MLQEIISVNKPAVEGLVVEKRMQVFKEPRPLSVSLKMNTKKVLDEDSYIQVS
jgi:hypothetical protein